MCVQLNHMEGQKRERRGCCLEVTSPDAHGSTE